MSAMQASMVHALVRSLVTTTLGHARAGAIGVSVSRLRGGSPAVGSPATLRDAHGR